MSQVFRADHEVDEEREAGTQVLFEYNGVIDGFLADHLDVSAEFLVAREKFSISVLLLDAGEQVLLLGPGVLTEFGADPGVGLVPVMLSSEHVLPVGDGEVIVFLQDGCLRPIFCCIFPDQPRTLPGCCVLWFILGGIL